MTAVVNKRNSFDKRNLHLHYTSDEGFIKIFAPFRFVQKLFGSCRVDIRDGQVNAPTIFQKCYTVGTVAAFTYFGTSMMMIHTQKVFKDDKMSRILLIALSFLQFMCGLNIFHCRFLTRGNIQLFEKMESVDRVMELKCSDIHTLRKKHYNFNRAVVLRTVGIFIALAIITFYFTGGAVGIQYEIFGNFWGLTAFIFEIVCCASHIKFFTMRVNLINKMISKHLKLEKFNDASASSYLIHLINKSNNQQQNLVSSDTEVYLNDIFSSFTCFQNQYRFQIFIFCCMFVVGSVISLQYTITEFQSMTISLEMFVLDFMQLITFNAIQISLLVFFSLYSEEFLREVKITKKLSNSILSRYFDGPLREKAKRMLKLIEHEPPRFTVYDMWSVDARLLLNMFNIVTSAFVIILQFAFL